MAEGAGALREAGLTKEMPGPGWGLGHSDTLVSALKAVTVCVSRSVVEVSQCSYGAA